MTRPEAAASRPYRSSDDLDRIIRGFAGRLSRDFAAEIARDAADFKRRAVHRLKLHLPPGPGRPCLESVTRAAELRAQGEPWKEIYPACIPGHATMDPTARVRSRRYEQRKRRRNRPGRPGQGRAPALVARRNRLPLDHARAPARLGPERPRVNECYQRAVKQLEIWPT